MSDREFFSDIVAARVGKPTKKLLGALLKHERVSDKKVTQSDIVRIAIIRYARYRLGAKADQMLSKGALVE